MDIPDVGDGTVADPILPDATAPEERFEALRLVKLAPDQLNPPFAVTAPVIVRPPL